MTVLRYIQDAPLRGLTFEHKQRAGALASYTLRTAMNAISNEKRLALESHSASYRDHDAVLLDLQKRLAILDE